MKRIKKIMAGIMAAAMIGSVGTANIPVSAEESEEKIYTLSELFEMSDEDFLELDDNDKNFYDIFQQDYYDYPDFFYPVAQKYNWNISPEYIPNVTEKKIEILLEGMVEYSIASTIDIDDSVIGDLYWKCFGIKFPEYSGKEQDLTDEDLIELAKCCYCVDQIVDVETYNDLPIMNGPSGTIQLGDVNLDNITDLYDAIWIASDLAGIFDFTDGQRLIGDVNEDGECNLYDAIEIAKGLM